jgi:hypothetical protein
MFIYIMSVQTLLVYFACTTSELGRYGFDYASLIAQNCAVAAQMIDARDKFFMSTVQLSFCSNINASRYCLSMSMPAYDIGMPRFYFSIVIPFCNCARQAFRHSRGTVPLSL